MKLVESLLQLLELPMNLGEWLMWLPELFMKLAKLLLQLVKPSMKLVELLLQLVELSMKLAKLLLQLVEPSMKLVELLLQLVELFMKLRAVCIAVIVFEGCSCCSFLFSPFVNILTYKYLTITYIYTSMIT